MKNLKNRSEKKPLKVLINGIPNLRLIPSDRAREIIAALERTIASFYEKDLQEQMENTGKLLTR